MILYDLSMTVKADMTVYKNRVDKKPRFTVIRDFSDSAVYETRMEIDLHTGTHLDMPLHMLPGGNSSDHWPVDNIFSHCTVFDFTDIDSDRITAADLQQKADQFNPGKAAIGQGRSLLLKTINSRREDFDYNFTYLDRSGALFLAEKNIGGVGIDALGLERDQPGHETHHFLLEAGVWILEGLRMAQVPEGFYILAVVPLKIEGVEALPARALLLSPDSAGCLLK